MTIGNINLSEFPLLLAPMEDVSDPPFRALCKENGADLMYTEFISSEGLIRDAAKSVQKLDIYNKERPIGIQIFGANLDSMLAAVEIVEATKPDIIDINFGCPVPKITKKGAGSAALKDLDIMKDMVEKVVKKVKHIPVTVKMRAGWDSNNIIIKEAGKILENAGIQAITLHARTSKQLYKGYADWNLIKLLKNNVNIPVIGNGDVTTIKDFDKIISDTGCDAVMIGRGALGNPWIFKNIVNHIENTQIYKTTLKDVINVCIEHIELLEEHKSSIACINLSKKHINFYLKNFKNSSIYRKELMKQEKIEDIKDILVRIKS